MRLFILSFVLMHGLSTFAFSPFAKRNVSGREADVKSLPEFNPHKLLEPRKPEIYTKAMLELKRLEEEPICHRVAVQLLMNNCHGLDIAEAHYQLESAHIQRHHVESFAASLAICDLERGGFVIPSACHSFTSLYLMRASQDGKGQLQVSPDQVRSCLEALGQDHSHWMTWLSYRDKALLFCRAARLDIDKDQAILHNKKLTQIMAEFAGGLENDLKNLKMAMVEHARNADFCFEDVRNHAEHLKTKIQSSVEALSSDFKDATVIVKSSLNSAMHLQGVLKTLLNAVIQSNAEVALGQEQALMLTTNLAKSQMESLNERSGETLANLAELKESILLLFPAIISLGERQDVLDRRSDDLFIKMKNMTELLQDHTDNLEQASITAYNIQHSLEMAATIANSWNETAVLGGTLGDYAIRIAGPVATIFLGNYGLAPSLARNALLIVVGFGLAETIVQWRHLNCDLSWPQMTLTSIYAASMTQFPHLLYAVEYEDITTRGGNSSQ